ncbi:unnamed protein product [Didymodactylos carnosus]|uniref:Uncharacterized protein n=1 Tax=Didymodactylos carnosus TaxID=1234261 RepID=A0A813VT71_9BILA|nr:unnamed protein product [Didymodactylos carnosus]CAF3632181.1 unnamed protein product [Didymodactylos carnosus]
MYVLFGIVPIRRQIGHFKEYTSKNFKGGRGGVRVCKSKKSSPVFPGNQPYSGAYPAYPMAPPQYYNGYPPPYNSQTKRPPNSGPQQQNTGLRQQRQNTDLRQQRQNTNRDTDPDYFGERQNSSVSGVTAPQQWDYGAPMPSVSE